MPSFICVTCGTGYPPAEMPPTHCPICEDERQYVRAAGQAWTTMEELRAGHRNDIRELEPGLLGVGSTPQVAIGQRALFVAGEGGGVLWDLTPLVTDEAVARLNTLGGVRAMAISHPHFFTTMADWSEALGGVPIYLHESNRQYVVHPTDRIHYWQGETHDLGEGITLVRTGGHYEGSTVLHWAGGAGGRGALFTGDSIMVVPDTRYMSFMRSYPNLVPLPARTVRAIAAAVEPYPFDRVYAGWWDRVASRDGKARLARSVERYIAAIG
jgi:glyoxylase-like metal-dependent hydrolase (beta-lactamase superfamily II)